MENPKNADVKLGFPKVVRGPKTVTLFSIPKSNPEISKMEKNCMKIETKITAFETIRGTLISCTEEKYRNIVAKPKKLINHYFYREPPKTVDLRD